MKHTEFKAAMAAKRAAAKATPEVALMSAPSEARQRIEAFIAENKAKLAFNKNK